MKLYADALSTQCTAIAITFEILSNESSSSEESI